MFESSLLLSSCWGAYLSCEWYLVFQTRNISINFVFTSSLLQIIKYYILAHFSFLTYSSNMSNFPISLSNIWPNLVYQNLYLNQISSDISLGLMQLFAVLFKNPSGFLLAFQIQFKLLDKVYFACLSSAVSCLLHHSFFRY